MGESLHLTARRKSDINNFIGYEGKKYAGKSVSESLRLVKAGTVSGRKYILEPPG